MSEANEREGIDCGSSRLLSGAWCAYVMAVREFLDGREFPSDESIDEVASQYGRSITDADSLEEVAEWFNWEKITGHLESR